jgi:hypothetical protein
MPANLGSEQRPSSSESLRAARGVAGNAQGDGRQPECMSFKNVTSWSRSMAFPPSTDAPSCRAGRMTAHSFLTATSR